MNLLGYRITIRRPSNEAIQAMAFDLQRIEPVVRNLDFKTGTIQDQIAKLQQGLNYQSQSTHEAVRSLDRTVTALVDILRPQEAVDDDEDETEGEL
jgi:DNA anti-recombination protein RmuC